MNAQGGTTSGSNESTAEGRTLRSGTPKRRRDHTLSLILGFIFAKNILNSTPSLLKVVVSLLEPYLALRSNKYNSARIHKHKYIFGGNAAPWLSRSAGADAAASGRGRERPSDSATVRRARAGAPCDDYLLHPSHDM